VRDSRNAIWVHSDVIPHTPCFDASLTPGMPPWLVRKDKMWLTPSSRRLAEP
jgi:hypothetical protein